MRTTPTTQPNLPNLTERDAAGLLGLSPATLRAWRERGRGPRYARLGRAIRYAMADLAAFAWEGNAEDER